MEYPSLRNTISLRKNHYDHKDEYGKVIYGTRYDDHLVGTNYDDKIYGLEGDDCPKGLKGNDYLWGG